MTIKKGFCVPQDNKNIKNKPTIYVRGSGISDDPEGSTVTVLILCVAYSEDGEQGYKELAHVLEKIRQHLLEKRIIGRKHCLKLPILTDIPDDQPYPLWWGGMQLTYSIGQTDSPIEKYLEENRNGRAAHTADTRN